MFRKVSQLLNIFLIITFSATAQWKVVKSVSVAFKIRNAGIGVDGSFKKATAQVSIDDGNPSNSTFSGVADANSVATGINLRDTHLKEKDEFFNVKKFPTLTMKSVSVVLKAPGVYTVTWDLTIKGITRRFTSQVNAIPEGNLLHLSTEFKINRNEWKVGGNSMTMGDIVTIKLKSTISK